MSENKTEKERSWLSHPLTTMIVGFLLTGVLGTALTQNFMDRREREKLRSQAVIARKEAVKELSELMAARQLHAQLFVEAIESGASSEEIAQRKAEHQEAYETWRTRRASTMLLARDLMSDAHYRDFVQFVDIRLVENTFVPIRGCISDAFLKSKERKSALTAIERCDVNGLIQRSIKCGDAIVETLYVFAAAGTSRSGVADSKAVGEAIQRVEQDCP
jgi:hypothetical protein